MNKLGKSLHQWMRKYGIILFLNSLILVPLLALAAYIKFAGLYNPDQHSRRVQVLIRLFDEPFWAYQPYLGLLTNISELLWCISATVCLFSFFLLKALRERRKADYFILYAGILLAILLIDDMFRITLMLALFAKVPKVVMYSIYGGAAIAYGLYFWRRILLTPYVLLILSGFLFVLSALADSTHFQGTGTPIMLEDGTKFLGILNIAIYFSRVCTQEIARSRN
ncbi:hypothetical protein [Oscillatoria sp. FACHB-1406]|uniref:hypothetical protein n=1 Tax=Oscillatoria sp. FACHB-1406 TaxID=2692846 RepID=UPI001682ED12|nr:hypothetical protein [Oscillatoria sp. FACHB-1406]MBD2577588.1 hypothetical protein [Oscillatoria sp. FACHB-1406]